MNTRPFRKARTLRLLQPVFFLSGRNYAKEILYQNMVTNALSAHNAKRALFPVGNAANYSLLYVMLRAILETPAKRVLEIGAGQSSILCDAIGSNTTTLETDETWAQRIGSVVRHKVIYSPLECRTVRGIATQGFSIRPEGEFDLVLVDGPLGSRRRSRWGALEVLEKHLTSEFLVIFDDAHRRGEQDTIREFIHDRNVGVHFVNSVKSQCLVYTSAFGAAAFF